MLSTRIKLLVVDDSALVRKIITESLSKDRDIEVVGTAMDPIIAKDKILKLNPDVITLDIEMPRMDGLTFLKLVMKNRPMPVIIFSSLTQEGSQKAMEALQAGAVDILAKPSGSFSAYEDGTRLAEKIKTAAQVKFKPRPASATEADWQPSSPLSSAALVRPALSTPAFTPAPMPTIHRPVFPAAHPAPKAVSQGRQYSPRHVFVLGASTGGTEALKTVLTALPADLPGICVVQHIPAYFSLAFANRLNDLCQLEVREARHGDDVRPGLVLVAPGGHHMVLRWVGNHYVVELNDGPPVHHQRPAVDVLFDSAVKAGAGPHSLAVVMTGMGADGAVGMLKLREAGATTIAQNEETCVVFGMPREAIRIGAAQHVLSLYQIAARLDRHATEIASSSSTRIT
jgi:two-component system, chemotaxis family, protein-glutamate methylesterase/glutaminase